MKNVCYIKKQYLCLCKHKILMNMRNNEENSDRKKRWQRWTTIMSYSLIIWIASVAALIITDNESSLALIVFLISTVIFWVGFASLLSLSAKEPWI